MSRYAGSHPLRERHELTHMTSSHHRFVAIILAGFSARSGAALLTTEQRHWVDLRRTIWQQRPSRQPTERPTGFRSWCFDRAVSKGGWWNTSIGLVYLVHCVTLLSQTYDNSAPGGQGNTVRGARVVLHHSSHGN